MSNLKKYFNCLACQQEPGSIELMVLLPVKITNPFDKMNSADAVIFLSLTTEIS